ncbi:hypothetical protein [Corynebacterium glyciniphilum]|uniref:hypothetical protein n=1 Tax=Corynebacterium glyciniphilum TaxID=1404244 RepID=UPI0011AB375E|nr:hypothetical protein [Corynebacterium glyciniphilum]
MSDTNKKLVNWDNDDWRRKALYAGVVVAAVVLSLFGLIDPVAIDDTVEKILQVGGPLIGLFGVKAYRNVDVPKQKLDAERSKAREEARTEALAEARAEAEKMLAQVRAEARSSANQVGDILAAKLDELPDSVRSRVSEGIRAVYSEPYGKHDIQADDPEPEPDPAGPGRYPGA